MTNKGVLIDTHSHLEMINDIPGVIERARNNGVGKIIAVSSDLNSSKRSVKLSQEFQNVYSAVGIHPHESTTTSEEVLSELKHLAAQKKVIAIGETGLDYHYMHSPVEYQILSFKDHIILALTLDLPLIIHIRDAFEEVLSILRQSDSSNACGVIHCFTGDYERAKKFIDLGFYISFSGIVTFKKAEEIRDVAKRIPIDRLLVETDSPYLAPVPFRGKKNEPAYVKLVAELIAELRDNSLEKIAEITTANATKLFRFDNEPIFNYRAPSRIL